MAANENATTARKTLDDPIGQENLEKLAQLQDVEIQTALQLMGMRHEEIRLLAASRRIEDERHKLFETLLMERGFAPSTPATIDPETGKITLVSLQGKPTASPT